MRDVALALREHLEAALATGIDTDSIIGIFVFGSQNYQCDVENSDVDTKLLIVPTGYDACFTMPDTRVITLPNNEHCEVMDIRHFINMLFKQNINFVEVLFTKYYILMDKYRDIFIKYFISNREEIARYDIYKAIRSITGQTAHTLRQDPSNGKKVGNGYRLIYFLRKYIEGAPYEQCMIPSQSVQMIVRHFKESITPVDTRIAFDLLENIDSILGKVDFQSYSVKEDIKQLLKTGVWEMICSRANV